MNHIKKDDDTWCGATLDAEFHFKDIDQVLINNLHGERCPCPLCIDAIVTILKTIPLKAQLTSCAQNGITGS